MAAEARSVSREFTIITNGAPLGKRKRPDVSLSALLATANTEDRCTSLCDEAVQRQRPTKASAAGLVFAKCRNGDDSSKIRCLLCNKKLSPNESNMTKHLSRIHKHIWNNVLATVFDNSSSTQEEWWRKVRSAMADGVRESQRGQLKFEKRNLDKNRRSLLRYLWTTVRGIPRVALGDDLFQLLAMDLAGCTHTLARAPACDRCTIQSASTTATHIPALSEAALHCIRQYMEDNGYDTLSLTADGWTTSSQAKCLVVTGHFLTESFQPVTFVVGMEPLALGDGTAQGLGGQMKSIASSFSRSSEQGNEKALHLVTLTTDSEKAMLNASAAILGDDNSLGCFAHTLQLVVNDALKNEPYSGALAKVRAISSTLLHSSAGAKVSAANPSAPKPLLPPETRWAWWHTMLERFLGPLQMAVQQSVPLLEPGDWVLDEAEQLTAEALVYVLEPFAAVTKECEGDTYCTIALIPQWIGELQDFFPNHSIGARL